MAQLKKIRKCEKSSNPDLGLLTKKSEVRGDMTISEVVTHHPETMAVFFRHGMTCFGCPMALQETVSQGAEAHGLSSEEMLKELNSAISKKSKKK
jgi:hybrid cluster-associated redox disulfide protein